ncbi:hypothetical protein ACSLBF_06620 [Pseudoalteromonas sp. T1lg65]|uniref:hypothetical protein n=1 Tax=Pseudoalteromonas sp. T1lg65 TaxID=2077101 RepID=UPI003F78C6E3
MIDKLLTSALISIFLVACSDPGAIIHESSEKSESSVTRNVCIENSPCSVSEGISIYLSSESVEPETPFVIYLQSAKQVEVKSAWLEGETMNMGKIPLLFDPQTLQADAMVGVCTDKSMRWLFKAEVVLEGKLITISQPISVTYHG